MTWAWLMVVLAAPLPPTAPPPAWVEAVDVPKPVVASTEPVVMLLRCQACDAREDRYLKVTLVS